MSETHSIDVKKHIRSYMVVFVALMTLTVVTVLISYLHPSLVVAVIIALFVASIKASLVAAYFMHLISEKKLILVTLAFTAFFFIALLALPTLEVFSRR